MEGESCAGADVGILLLEGNLIYRRELARDPRAGCSRPRRRLDEG